MTYVHAVVRRDGDGARCGADLDRMLAAVHDFPWLRVDREVVSDGGPACAFAVMVAADSESPETSLAVAGETGVMVAADLLLDDPSGLDAHRETPRSDLASGLAQVFRRHGEQTPERVSADGVALVWDRRTRQLLAWRDVAGTRPLYYHLSAAGTLVVSSDLRSLVAHPEVARRLDLAHAKALIGQGLSFTHPSRTLYRDVLKLPAAHLLSFDEHALRVRPYWRASEIEQLPSGDPRAFAAEVQDLVRAAVERRVPAGPAPLAAHLSGGLDSSSIAVLASRAAGSRESLAAYSWAPTRDLVPPMEDDERPLAEAVARLERLTLHLTDVDVGDLVEHSTRDLALLPTTTQQVEFAVSRHAASIGAHTILSGWGGDELIVFNGRGYFADLARRGRWLRAHRELHARTRMHDSSTLSGWRGRVVRPLIPDGPTRLLERRGSNSPSGLPLELRPEFAEELNGVQPLAEVGLARERPGVRRTQVSLLTDGHLQYRAEAWAAHGASLGLTYRFPLLARPVVEFALAVPDEVFFRDGWKRWLYREAMAGVLPDEVRWHPHKQDNALARSLQRVAPSTREPYQERLRQRAANPFVDVAQLEPEARARARSQTDAPSGTAAWLAFVQVDDR